MTEKVKDILEKINKSWYLPTLQRDYVWLKNSKQKKVEKLFDSLMLGYPIGQIVLWKTDKNIKDFTVYTFLNHFSYDEKNESGGISINKTKVEYLILDGQQRLTSLFISLNGTGYIQTEKDKKYLYINLLHNEEKQLVDDMTYDFRFLTSKQADKCDISNLWFKVSDIMDSGKITNGVDFADNFIENLKADPNLNEIIIKNEKKIVKILQKMWTNIREKEINFERVEDTNIDKILEIFVRLNDGGKPLEKSDLLLSFMESKSNLFGSKGARAEISNYVTNEINGRNCGIESKVTLEKDLLLKACLMLSDLPVAYKIDSFTNENLGKIAKRWNINKKTISLVYKLLDKYNFTDSTIIAKNALLPIAYYLKIKKLDKLVFISSTEANDIRERAKIIKWLSMVLLAGVFGGSSDTTLTEYRKSINEFKELQFIGAKQLTKKIIADRVEKASYKSKYSQLILFLTTDPKYWETSQDHIFAQKKFDNKPLSKYKKYKDGIANLQLLSVPENARKNDGDILPWLEKHKSSLTKTNLYPSNIKLSDENFFDFYNTREKLIIKRLCEIFEITK